MNKKAQGFTINGVITIILLAIMGFGVVSGLQNLGRENIDKLVTAFQEDNNVSIQKKGGAAMLFFISQGAIAPAIRKDWLPPKDKYIYILEDFPVLDGTDFILIIPFLFLAIWIAKKIEFDSLWKNILAKILLLVFFALFGYVAWKIIMLYVYYWSAETIGIGKDMAIMFREKIIDATARFAGLMTALTLVAALGLFKIFKKDD